MNPMNKSPSLFSTVLRKTFFGAALALSLSVASSARADELGDAQKYVEKQNDTISRLLKQPASAARDSQISGTLDGYVDYDELTRRAFGEPCPTTKTCVNHWATLNADQKTQVRDLLKKLVEKNYRKNLIKTLDWDVAYKGAREAKQGESRVRTEAKNKVKPRDPSVQVDYLVRGTGGAFKVVDIVTEGSSLTKNYYDQFARMMANPAQGFPYVTKKLTDRINKRD